MWGTLVASAGGTGGFAGQSGFVEWRCFVGIGGLLGIRGYVEEIGGYVVIAIAIGVLQSLLVAL